MRVSIPKEVHPGERRVAASPTAVKKLLKMGFAEVLVEKGAGEAASFGDSDYEQAGAKLVDRDSVFTQTDLLLKVRPMDKAEAGRVREGANVISYVYPASNKELVQSLAARKVTLLAMDCMPRISRAQKMDALSAMSNISGYRAVVEAASHFGSFFTAQMTAAGRVPPAKVLVIGAGVAGLAAIAAARGLGAVVRAFDTRAAAKEQVQSLGAEFLEVHVQESGEGGGGYAKVMSPEYIKAEMELFYQQAKEVDIVITTALIPGRPAPKLWEKRAVEAMKPGSVVIDMAAEQGGNCELTRPETVVVANGVKIIGYTDYASRLPTTASELYGNCLLNLLTDMGGGEKYHVDLKDEAVRGALVLNAGELMWPPPPVEPSPQAAAPKPAEAAKPKEPEKPAPRSKGPASKIAGLALLALWLFLKFTQTGDASPETYALLQHLTVFVLAVFVGWQVIWSVTAALHTPLMSLTNAISGIIVVGAMLQATGTSGTAALVVSLVGVLLAAINIVGGSLVTQRMLQMFRK
jgi:NAD(P) transhydrogenase subunit alpha